MGTRADFYVGKGKDAEWLGSIAWDGCSIDDPVLKAKTEDKYRKEVAEMLAGRDDATLPKDGWPWPWDDSQTTDYAYAFSDGRVMASCFGSAWFDPKSNPQEEVMEGPKAEFPDMKDRKRATLGKRSGLIIIQAPMP